MNREDMFKQWFEEKRGLMWRNPIEIAKDAFFAGLDAKGLSPREELLLETAREDGVFGPTAEDIYYEYPRHEGRQAAIKAIKKAILTRGCPMMGYDSAEQYIMTQTKAYAAAVAKWPRSARYTKDGVDTVPHPATWFNQGRYDDDPKCWERGTPSTNQITIR